MSYFTTDQARQAARENSTIKNLLNNGWRETGFYEYQDENGKPIYWRIRLDPPVSSHKSKWIRPFSFNGKEWVLKEPDFNGKKPLYLLPSIIQNPDAIIYIVEGERCADALSKLGVITTTSGGAGSVKTADWSYLQNRKVIIWPDNDQAGFTYATKITDQLQKLGCFVEWVDIEQLNLSQKDDCVDWLADNSDATKENIENLLLRTPLSLRKHKENKSNNYDYQIDDEGVYYLQTDEDSENTSRLWLCSRIDVEARTRDTDGLNHGKLLTFEDADSKLHRWAMPMEMLAGDGVDYRRNLLNMGVQISSGKKAREKLTDYLQKNQPEKTVLCVNQLGWHNGSFVFPDEVIGKKDLDEEVLFQSSTINVNGFKTNGTLESWQKNIATLCTGNSRLMLVISMAFAAPLVGLLGEENGGIHIKGASSTGKSTALKLARSVWGEPAGLEQWRATSNGLESVAAKHNDSLLCLDEMSQVDPKEAGEVAYMLANGAGKNRSKKDGTLRTKTSWRLLFCSSGETGLAEHIAQIGKKPKAGQEVRILEIPADAGRDLGIFENLHGFGSGADLSRHLLQQAKLYYGTPIREFLKRMTAKDMDAMIKNIQELTSDLYEELPIDTADGQVKRAAMRFALIATAGEVASDLGVTGWELNEATLAVIKCFESWLNERGGTGQQEVQQISSHIMEFFQKNSQSRFSSWAFPKDKVFNKAGFVRTEDQGGGFLVETEVFENELCCGYTKKQVTKICVDNGWLIPDKNGSATTIHRMPDTNKPRRMYHFSDKVLGDAENAE